MQAIQYMQIAGVRKIAAAIINALKPHGYVPRWNLFMLCQQMEKLLLGALKATIQVLKSLLNLHYITVVNYINSPLSL